MTLPASEVIDAIRCAALLSGPQIARADALAATHPTAARLSAELVRMGWLTPFQAEELCRGRGLGLSLGAYVLLERLGAGGMGEVFRARHRVLNREDAVKRIRHDRLDTTEALARFVREAQAVAMLRHPNVVQIHDAGEDGGCHYLALELLDGVDLAEHLRRVGPLPVGEAVEYVRQACVGMQHACAKGLVHRDLKPANLMLCPGGVVKVMDLGLVLLEADRSVSLSKATFGTVDYMAPEQVRDSHKVDVRADVYSLGCTLYHLLTGRTPFHDAHPAARLMMHLSAQPDPVEKHRPEVPARLAAVVRKMMAKSPDDRYQSPGEAARALLAVAHPPAEPAPARPVASRGGSMWHGIALGLALALGIVGAAATFMTPSGEAVAEAVPRKEPPRQDVVASRTPPVAPSLPPEELPPPEAEREASPPEPRPKPKSRVPGQTFANGIGMRFVRIPAGSFVMGTPSQLRGGYDDELEHVVEIGRGFWMGVHEVTQKQYRGVTGKNPSHFRRDGPGANAVRGLDTDDFPVECVSWHDAENFLATLSRRAEAEGLAVTYRLPTEAEWEFACRGTYAYKPFHFGDALGSESANFNGAHPFGGANARRCLGRPAMVGAYPANTFGLHDMHGNVKEWCQDWYEGTYYRSSPQRDPQGPSSGMVRVLRGGGWRCFGRCCRSSYRYFAMSLDNDVGFRAVAVPAP